MEFECRNELCIYQDEEYCTLKNISINEYGICDCYMSPNINDNDLKELKESTIIELNNRVE